MAYGDSIGNNNIGVSSSMYQGSFVNTTTWNFTYGTVNRNPRMWLSENGYGPMRVDTNYSPSTNTGFSIPRNKDRLFWVNLYRASSTTISTVGFTSPISTSQAVSKNGWENAGLSNNQSYLTITCTVNYPYSFTAWRVNSSSGTTGTTVQTTNIFFNSTYGGTNFLNITAFYAI